MVIRWRTIASGFFDWTINLHVRPLNLLQAAINLSMRHIELTGVDHKISVKTLDDYAEKITISNESEQPLDLALFKD